MTSICPSINDKLEVAEVFRQHKEKYLLRHRLTAHQHKVLNAILYCRTSANGYHVERCDKCQHEQEAYNSCRDRHCPKCQGINRNIWVSKRVEEILPVPHYHVVFTLPSHLQELVIHNRRLIYDILFSSSAATLQTFGRDPKWLGGEIGFYGVLHTWGQTLWLHPHVHYIVPGGALSGGGQWISPSYEDKFLFPVRALSKVFRGKFIQLLKAAYYERKFIIPEDRNSLRTPKFFETFIDHLVSRNWVVYCKSPFADAKSVVNYIGRYTHRVAISNARIVSINDSSVGFRYKEKRDQQTEWKTMDLDPQEFIRRFIWHILPTGFHKIRYYGFLANGRRKKYINLIRSLLCPLTERTKRAEDFEMVAKCPQCGVGQMRTLMTIDRFGQIFINIAQFPLKRYGFDTS
jgi:ssDNA-binding Zn-finger/Zn-ribbon topoisomerase 1